MGMKPLLGKEFRMLHQQHTEGTSNDHFQKTGLSPPADTRTDSGAFTQIHTHTLNCTLAKQVKDTQEEKRQTLTLSRNPAICNTEGRS